MGEKIKKIFFYFILTLSFIPTNSFSKERPYQSKQVQIELSELEKEMSNYHYQFISNSKRLYEMQQNLQELKDEVHLNLEVQEKKQKKLVDLIKKITVSSLYEEEDGSGHFLNEVLRQKIKDQQKEILAEKEKNNVILNNIFKMSEKLEEYKQFESKITQFLDRLKKQREEKRVEKQEEKQGELSKTIEKSKAEGPKLSKQNLPPQHLKNWIFPFQESQNIKGQGKGISVLVKGHQRILAGLPGQIIHVGALSTLGNVIVIDHGDGMRSVHLGPISETVGKNEYVKKGQVIGIVNESKDKDVSVYFELRKNETILNAQEILKLKDKG
jgi:murein DD-endopeptidase MepM/ murein hydrolase activator NlpD